MKKLTPHGIAEIVFDIVYLVFAITAGIWMLLSAKEGNTALLLYGILALVLGGGDAFHLVPRIYGHLHGMDSCTKALGIGKLVTSITMTIFYLLLYLVWVITYHQALAAPVSLLLILLAALRILLCLFPQNRWTSKNPPQNWAIYRNLPFLAMGVIIILLFFNTSLQFTDGFRFMDIAIFLSFLFYLPVVVFAQRYPKTGALMMPKTAAYVWIIFMGFHLM